MPEQNISDSAKEYWRDAPAPRYGLKPRFFFRPAGGVGAIEYYRGILPLRMMEEQGLAECFFETQGAKSQLDAQKLNEYMMRADFVLFLNRPGLLHQGHVRDLSGLKPAKTRPYGDVKYPPSIVWSIDDNYHWVHPSNPSFQHNGYRLPDGTLLKNDDTVAIPTSNGGSEIMWRGGQLYNGDEFLPENNKKVIDRMDQMIREHAISCAFASPRLEKFYRDEIGYKNTFFMPNCVEFNDYLPLLDSKFTRTDGSVRVLWQGGASHFMDLYPLRAPLLRLVSRMPQLQILIWGQLFTWITRELPDDNFRFIPWVHYDAYKTLMGMVDYDFALAPLMPGAFNEGKSAIKVYESAAVGKPTLAANVPPYSDEFVDGETVMLYDPKDVKEFEEKFEALAKDPALRDRIAKNAAEWCREHRDARKWAKAWFEHLQEKRGPNWGPNPDLADLLAGR